MHDYRFKQMEYTLPNEYLQEQELERQRKIHDSLITMGLELISDCYLEDMDRKCSQAGLTFEGKTADGKHSAELLREIEASGYDLVILGALGMGKVKDSLIGAVCERVTRGANTDVWVVKNLPEKDEPERDTIMVGIDGSPQSFGALRTGIELARRFDKKLDLIGVYDPYLHYAVFKSIVDVLNDKASKVFRFEEQNQLHEEIIDTGLAQIYQSHLEVAKSIADKGGVEVTTTLLDGKAFQKILDHARRTRPWVIIHGRTGIHGEEDEAGLGSNSENLLRLSPSDVLFTTRLEHPELDLQAEASIHWTPEADDRMTRVPEMVRGIARTAILRLAVEKGHSVVTNTLVTEAMERFMPKQTSQTTTKLAESLAIEHARRNPVSICRKCGVAASTAEPSKCSVCGATDFEVVTQEMVEKIAAAEGGVEEETTYDGRKVKWTKEARKALYSITDKYQMRRCKARIEKKARMSRIETITLDFAGEVIGEETGEPIFKVDPAVKESPQVAPTSQGREAQVPIVATDPKGNPLASTFEWTEDALERIFRVPSGFMRSKTQERIEELANQQGKTQINLEVVEAGIEVGRQMMSEMMGQYSAASSEADNQGEQGNGSTLEASAEEGTCPASEDSVKASGNGGSSTPLNETGWMSEMAKRRKKLLD
jgi:nucleotide-binding universal stress UspA family protein